MDHSEDLLGHGVRLPARQVEVVRVELGLDGGSPPLEHHVRVVVRRGNRPVGVAHLGEHRVHLLGLEALRVVHDERGERGVHHHPGVGEGGR